MQSPQWLQCGHGHEAVENMRLTLPQARSLVLQCGHGHEAVENLAEQFCHPPLDQASMRPRP